METADQLFPSWTQQWCLETVETATVNTEGPGRKWVNTAYIKYSLGTSGKTNNKENYENVKLFWNLGQDYTVQNIQSEIKY